MTMLNSAFSIFDASDRAIRWQRPIKGVPSSMKKNKTALNETLKQEFKKDLELFEYFLLLLNASSPIRNVELMWADDLELFDPSQRPRVNTGDALVQLQVNGGAPARTSPSPSTYFCDLVHGFGAHEEQTCARSDKPAKERCRATGRSHVYPCHVGLTDIAVPVICEDRYLGTLFSGQVLTEPPSAEGFERVRAALAGQAHIDMARLEEAYYRVPVVTSAQLAEMVRMMEVFARYLSNSWRRLEIMSEFQQIRERELALDRREVVEKLLSSHGAIAPTELQALVRSVGLDRAPDRVLLLRLQDPRLQDAVDPPSRSVGAELLAPGAEAIGTQLTQARVSHLIEDRCRAWPNTLAALTGHGEICVFTSQELRTPHHERLLIDEIAQALLRLARSHGLVSTRIGVSRKHTGATELLGAYYEAASALATGQSTVNWFEGITERHQEPTQMLSALLKALQDTNTGAITAATREFLATAAPVASGMQQLQQGRGLLTWACEHLTREVIGLGASAEQVNACRERAIQVILGSRSSLPMADAFRSFVEQLRLEVVHLFSHRELKIVSETQRLVREQGADKVTVHSLAQALKISAGHLGRLYSRTAGHTLEEYLIRQKLEMSKRLLLDPRLQIAEVADRCGFCNPAYFASVFKKYMHCTPRAYGREPQRWGAPESNTIETAEAAI
jgi:AraC-like DNA-binding protein/ligand-binding sensor protein